MERVSIEGRDHFYPTPEYMGKNPLMPLAQSVGALTLESELEIMQSEEATRERSRDKQLERGADYAWGQ